MYNVIKEGSGEVPRLCVGQFYPSEHNYQPKVFFSVCYNEVGFHAHFDVYETNPKAIHTKHFDLVHQDSCVEWFAKFASDIDDRYFNFEVNANGVMNVSFRKNRNEDIVNLTEEDVLSLNIKTEILSDCWTVDYTVPFELLKKFIKGYEFDPTRAILANVYKCGDYTDLPHYGCWNLPETEVPDFHRPEFFREMRIV